MLLFYIFQYILQAHVTLHYSRVCSDCIGYSLAIASSYLDFIICQHYATCNAVMKFQYMNGLSHTHTNAVAAEGGC